MRRRSDCPRGDNARYLAICHVNNNGDAEEDEDGGRFPKGAVIQFRTYIQCVKTTYNDASLRRETDTLILRGC